MCMDQFEAIPMQAPNWYVGDDTFSVHNFNYFMKETMESAESYMVPKPDGNFKIKI